MRCNSLKKQPLLNAEKEEEDSCEREKGQRVM